MKTLIIICLLILLLISGSIAQQLNNFSNSSSAEQDQYRLFSNEVDTAWVRQYGSGSLSGEDYSNAVTVDNDGNFYVTGSSGTVKYNQFGVEQWVVEESGIALAVDDSKNIYITGNGQTIKYNSAGLFLWSIEKEGIDIAVDVSANVFITNTIDGNYTTTKLSTNGVEQWEAIYNSLESWDLVTGLALDSYGNVYVTGSVDFKPIPRTGTGYYKGFGTIKYDTFGVEEWAVYYTEPADTVDHRSSDIVVDESGSVYIIGSVDNFETGFDYTAIKYNSSGIEQWAVSYNGSGNSGELTEAICVDNSGNVYVTGSSVTVKYNISGAEQWVIEESGVDIATDPTGNVYLTSHKNDNFATFKYSPAGVEQWMVYYDGTANEDDIPVALACDNEGNVIITGSSESEGKESDYVTIKYNSIGEEQCCSHFNTSGLSDDSAEDIVVDDDGNVFVTGSSRGPISGNDFVTIKYNSNGDEIWRVRYNAPENSDDVAIAIVLDDLGDIYITGNNEKYPEYNTSTIKYSTDGELLWVARHTLSTEVNALAVDGLGNAYIAGSLESDYFTTKYNTSGEEQWTAIYEGPGNYFDEATALAVDDSGNVFVTGSAWYTSSNQDYLTIKYNSYGEEQWVAFYSGPANLSDYATAIALDSEGNVFVTGTSVEVTTGQDFTTIKYNSSGEEQWIALYDRGGSRDRARDIALDGFGNVYVTGESRKDPTGEDYVTVKYNSEGAELWEARYDVWLGGVGYSNEKPNAIYVDKIGNTYVTGSSNGSNNWFHHDYATIKYNSSGEEQWVVRYLDGEPAAIVIDGSENVYVTGTSLSKYTTIKYIQAPVSIDNSITNVPMEYTLSQNYPNPFNPTTTISYAIPERSLVELKVYDVLGNEVAVLLNQEQNVGYYELNFNASDLPSGVYFYRLQAGDFIQTKKMLLLK